MIEKRLVQWYASSSGVDLDIAEREIVLTYVLQVFHDAGLLSPLAFKGGTAIRKIFLGNQGRFSMDLDFTMLEEINQEEFILAIVSTLHDHEHYGIHFNINPEDYYANPDSCGAVVTYRHEWADNGKFSIQVSFRAKPILPIQASALIQERYFQWLGIDVPVIPTLDLHEIIGEKIRASAQRRRVRDLYDLYQFASVKFERNRVRRIAIMKCWETGYAFSPETFLTSLPDQHYDWADLERLVKKSRLLTPAEVFGKVQQDYHFLTEMDQDERILANDPYLRERKVYQHLLAEFK
jgi:predicted nucleotidyltransferase component of viral defense system